MTRHRTMILASMALATALLTACSGGTPTGIPTTAASSTSTTTAPAGNTQSIDVPKVQNPLPAKVLDGNPCDTALTGADVNRFLGTSDPAKPGSNTLGLKCDWDNAAGSGAGITVFYHSKAAGGLSDAYQNVKPTAVRWDELQPVQGYPAIGYLPNGDDPSNKRDCQIVVGVADNLTYSVGLTLGDSVVGKKDPCDVGRNVADAVMTNIKARA